MSRNGSPTTKDKAIFALTRLDLAVIEHALIEYRRYLETEAVQTSLVRERIDEIFTLYRELNDFSNYHLGDIHRGADNPVVMVSVMEKS